MSCVVLRLFLLLEIGCWLMDKAVDPCNKFSFSRFWMNLLWFALIVILIFFIKKMHFYSRLPTRFLFFPYAGLLKYFFPMYLWPISFISTARDRSYSFIDKNTQTQTSKSTCSKFVCTECTQFIIQCTSIKCISVLGSLFWLASPHPRRLLPSFFSLTLAFIHAYILFGCGMSLRNTCMLRNIRSGNSWGLMIVMKFCELWYVVYLFFLSPFNIFGAVFAQLANYVGGEYCLGFTDMTNRSFQ